MEKKRRKDIYIDFLQKKNNFQNTRSVKSVKLYDTRVGNPFLSFVVPTYGRPKYLFEAIESIVNCKPRFPYEIIVVDNSGEVTDNPILKMLQISDVRNLAFYVNLENLGMAGNWNRCILLARSNWISMLHDDDLLAPEYGSEILKCLKTAAIHAGKKPIGAIKVTTVEFKSSDQLPQMHNRNRGGVKLCTLANSLLHFYGPTISPTCGILFKKEAVIKTGGFCEDYYPSLDSVLGFQLQCRGYNVFKTEDTLGFYRNEVNATGRKETIQAWSHVDHAFQRFCYSYTLPMRCLYPIFADVTYSMMIDSLLERANKYHCEPLKREDIDFMSRYGEFPIRRLIFRFIRKIVHLRDEIVRT